MSANKIFIEDQESNQRKIKNQVEVIKALEDQNENNISIPTFSIAGHLAIIVENKNSELFAIPLTLYNKRGKITLGIEHPNYQQIWGAKYGHWIQSPINQTNRLEYPIGLEVLIIINKLFISEYYNKSNELSKPNRRKVYLIKNILGDLVFVGKERINFEVRYPYGMSRQIDVKLYDPFKREILFCRQLLRLGNCLSSCCLHCMQIMAQPSKSIGTVRQTSIPFRTEFKINDQNEKTIFTVKANEKGFCSKNKIFDILSNDSKIIGQIKPSLKQDFVNENKEIPILSIGFKDGFNPLDKSRLIAAMFIIKYLYYD